MLVLLDQLVDVGLAGRDSVPAALHQGSESGRIGQHRLGHRRDVEEVDRRRLVAFGRFPWIPAVGMTIGHRASRSLDPPASWPHAARQRRWQVDHPTTMSRARVRRPTRRRVEPAPREQLTRHGTSHPSPNAGQGVTTTLPTALRSMSEAQRLAGPLERVAARDVRPQLARRGQLEQLVADRSPQRRVARRHRAVEHADDLAALEQRQVERDRRDPGGEADHEEAALPARSPAAPARPYATDAVVDDVDALPVGQLLRPRPSGPRSSSRSSRRRRAPGRARASPRSTRRRSPGRRAAGRARRPPARRRHRRRAPAASPRPAARRGA